MSGGLLALFPFLAGFMQLVAFCFAGVVAIAAIASALLERSRPELAGRFLRLLPRRPGTWMAFLFIPRLGLLMLYGALLKGISFPASPSLAAAGLLAVAGFFALFFGRRSARPRLLAAGALALLAETFFLLFVLQWLFAPETWAYGQFFFPYPFQLHPYLLFPIFLAAAVMTCGAGLIFFGGRERAVVLWGSGFALGGALAIPPLLFWDTLLLRRPQAAADPYIAAGALIVFLALLIYLALGNLLAPGRVRPAALLLCALAVHGLLVGQLLLRQLQANRELLSGLAAQLRLAQSQLTMRQQGLYTRNLPGDPQLGERIFRERCSLCHTYDRQLVGPALRAVLPKYLAKPAELRSFIDNPRRINPALPAMPRLGLAPREIDGVAKYLLETRKKDLLPKECP